MDEAIRNTIYVLNDVPSCFNYKLLWNSICANRYTDAEGVKGNLVTNLSQLGCGINEAVRHIKDSLLRSLKFVYYETMKRKLKIKPKYECRCNGRLQTKRSTLLSHTGLVVELEDLQIKTRLTNEKFASVKGECEI